MKSCTKLQKNAPRTTHKLAKNGCQLIRFWCLLCPWQATYKVIHWPLNVCNELCYRKAGAYQQRVPRCDMYIPSYDNQWAPREGKEKKSSPSTGSQLCRGCNHSLRPLLHLRATFSSRVQSHSKSFRPIHQYVDHGAAFDPYMGTDSQKNR